MLYFSRWRTLAILGTAFIVCAFAVPNFFSERTLQSLPKWAQRHIVLGLDLQGGSHLLLEVDSNAVRKEQADNLRDDVRRTLRDARIGYTNLAIRGLAVEVRIREAADLERALTRLRQLPLSSSPSSCRSSALTRPRSSRSWNSACLSRKICAL